VMVVVVMPAKRPKSWPPSWSKAKHLTRNQTSTEASKSVGIRSSSR